MRRHFSWYKTRDRRTAGNFASLVWGQGPTGSLLRVCGLKREPSEPLVIRMPDGREEVIPADIEMGAKGRYEDWVYLSMMEREWKRPVPDTGNGGGFIDSAMSPRATIVVLFWSHFETRIERLLRAGLAEAPPRLLDDALRRYSSIGARLNDFYRCV